MKKIGVSDIFKDVKSWKARVIDPNDPEVKALIERTRKAQAECLERKEIDWNRLMQVINI